MKDQSTAVKPTHFLAAMQNLNGTAYSAIYTTRTEADQYIASAARNAGGRLLAAVIVPLVFPTPVAPAVTVADTLVVA